MSVIGGAADLAELDEWENLVKLTDDEREVVSVLFEQVGYPRLPWGKREDGDWRQ